MVCARCQRIRRSPRRFDKHSQTTWKSGSRYFELSKSPCCQFQQLNQSPNNFAISLVDRLSEVGIWELFTLDQQKEAKVTKVLVAGCPLSSLHLSRSSVENKHHPMNEDSTSLNRLHDLALPPKISWWPLAPGWYVVLLILLLLVLRTIWQAWTKWKANAYRREALKELARADNASSVAEILRRTALAVAPRSEIAELTGEDWLKWLSTRCSLPVPDSAARLLIAGIYSAGNSSQAPDSTFKSLKDYASCWIQTHQNPNHKATA